MNFFFSKLEKVWAVILDLMGMIDRQILKDLYYWNLGLKNRNQSFEKLFFLQDFIINMIK